MNAMRPRARRLDNRRKNRTVNVRNNFRLRAMVVFSLFALAFGGMQLRLATMSLNTVQEPPRAAHAPITEAPRRGQVVDRNGVVMATTLNVYSLYADPKNIMDVNEVVTKLTGLMPTLDAGTLFKRLNREARFVWIKRNLTPKQAYEVNALGLPGLGFREENTRFYPQRQLAAHVLGGLNYEGKGIAGIEASYNKRLAAGENIQLTMDMRVQQALHSSLMEAVLESGAKAAWGVVLDPRNNNVLAMASLPDFDPNHYGSAHRTQWRNRAVQGVYEMGSTFKLFTAAQAMEDMDVGLNQQFDCTHPVSIGKFTIHDLYPKGRPLSLKEIVQYSSNIGAARIADTFEEGTQKAFFDKLRLLEKVDMGLSEMSAPLTPERWKRVQTMTMAFGHGIAVSPVNMASAVSSLIYDGRWRQPHLVADAKRPKPQQVVSRETVLAMRDIMKTVVKAGTGTNAAVKGYNIGGKTGTAEKIVDGAYDKNKNLASFVGVVPLDNPKLVALIMVDEGYKENGEGAGGGVVSAPAFARFVQRAAPILGIAPQTSQKLMAESYQIQKVEYEPHGVNWANRR